MARIRHCTILAIDAVATRVSNLGKITPKLCDRNACDGQRAEIDTQFSSGYALSLVVNNDKRNWQTYTAALKMLEAADMCPKCRVLLDAAFEGIDLGPQMRGEVK